MKINEQRDLIISEMTSIENYFSEFYGVNLHEEIFQEFLGGVFSTNKVYTGSGYEAKGVIPRFASRVGEKLTRGAHKAVLSDKDVLSQKYAREVSKRNPDGTKKDPRQYQSEVASHVKTQMASQGAKDAMGRLAKYAKDSQNALAAKNNNAKAAAAQRDARKAYSQTEKALAKQGTNSSAYITGIGDAAKARYDAETNKANAKKKYQSAKAAASVSRADVTDVLG